MDSRSGQLPIRRSQRQKNKGKKGKLSMKYKIRNLFLFDDFLHQRDILNQILNVSRFRLFIIFRRSVRISPTVLLIDILLFKFGGTKGHEQI